MGRPLNSAVWLLMILAGATTGWPQTTARADQAVPATYPDYPLPKLLKAVPDLQGLTPADTQDQLPSLLNKVAENIQGDEKKLPNLISHEDVTWSRVCPETHSYGGCLDSERHREFNYLILSHKNEDSETVLEEYRTDSKNRRIEPGTPDAPRGQGFASLWVLFSSANRSESHFRYLGRQKLGKHATALVVAFAQDPAAVKRPGEVALQGRSVPVWYQGIAWIDEANFQIVRLRTDLLQPRPDVHLQRLTAETEFGEVRISQLASALLLPVNVEITVEHDAEVSKEVHSYSKYRLYSVETKIVP